ncbi:MAG: histidine kinase [Cyclobacteriaceae bacterium]|nr:histidine kinase [Cyclobacteriaceae bacterium]
MLPLPHKAPFILLLLTHLSAFSQTHTDSDADSAALRKLNDQAYIYWYSNLDSVLILAKEQLLLATKTNNKIGIIKAHIDFWHVYNERQMFVEAIQSGFSILKEADLINSIKYRAVGFSNLGLTHYQMGENDLANEYLQKAMSIDSARNNKSGLASDYVNLSLVQISNNNFQEGERYAMLAFQIHENQKDDVGCSIALINAAYASYRLDKKEVALKRVEEVLKYSLKANDLEGQAYAYNYMVLFNNGVLPPREEIRLLQKSLNLCLELHLNELTRDNYQKLSESFSRINDLPQSLHYLQLSIQLSDSIYSTNKRVEAAKLNAKYKLKKNEIEIQSLKETMLLKEQSAARQRWIFVLVFAIVIAIGLFVWAYQRTVNKMVIAKAEASHIRRELNYLKDQTNPHFLLNALNSLYGVALTKPAMVPDKIAELSYLLHYQLKSSRLEKVNMAEEIEFVKRYIEFKKAKTNQLDLSFEVIGEFVGRYLPPLLFFPPIENALKYAAEADSPYVHIQWKFEPDKIILLVRNNFNLEFAGVQGTKIGIENLNKRLELYNYKFDLNVSQVENFYNLQLNLWDNELTVA